MGRTAMRRTSPEGAERERTKGSGENKTHHSSRHEEELGRKEAAARIETNQKHQGRTNGTEEKGQTRAPGMKEYQDGRGV